MIALPRIVGLVSVLAVVILVAAPAVTQPQANESAEPSFGFPRPIIFPIHSSPYGNGYGDWAAAWWQWAFALPVDGHPLIDETGAQCGAGQSGDVWYLGGVFNESGTAVRNECVVPAGKALFFPILNVECSNIEENGNDYVALGACNEFFMDLVTEVELTIDGVRIRNVREQFRVKSGTFNFTLPENNLLGFVGAPAGTCFVGPSGLCDPYLSVTEGFYVMLAPLSRGPHTIRLRGSFGDLFSLDVTYNLRVQG